MRRAAVAPQKAGASESPQAATPTHSTPVRRPAQPDFDASALAAGPIHLLPNALPCYVSPVTPTRQGSFHLFRFAGVDVFLHWSWFLVALYQITSRGSEYSSPVWNVLEYLALFAIVLLHEFGHALACRQVGGQASLIVLWPLGGVAYVSPPSRPGATLWSIAAGPLVNVVLVLVFSGLVAVATQQGSGGWWPDIALFLRTLWVINLAILVFNLLPVYPLDGGQILRSLLWFGIGRARSLMVAGVTGLVGVTGLMAMAFWSQSWWIGIMGIFLLLNCWRGIRQARDLAKLERLPRHEGFACPACRVAPPVAPLWLCGNCRITFDTFETGGACPQCGDRFPTTVCSDCGVRSPWAEWVLASPVPPRLP